MEIETWEEKAIKLKIPNLEIEDKLDSLDTSLLFESEHQSMDVQPYIPQDTAATEESVVGVCGLHNLGNTCYMNSVLQCLLHCDGLIQYFKDQSMALSSYDGVLKEFADLQTRYWNENWSIVVPKSFKEQLGLLHPQFAGSGQHDAQEFLALFLGSMHQELRKKIENKTVKKLGNIQIADRDQTDLYEEKPSRKRAKSLESTNDENLPNNKRIDSHSSYNKQHLTLNSFIGKEKKTANVNVLCTEVEVDEEATTDHSTKFPQMNNLRLNNGQFFDENVTGPPQNQSPHKCAAEESIDIAGSSTNNMKIKKLKHLNYKETNVLADANHCSSKIKVPCKDFSMNFEDLYKEELNILGTGDMFNKPLNYFQNPMVGYANAVIHDEDIIFVDDANDKMTSVFNSHAVTHNSMLFSGNELSNTLQKPKYFTTSGLTQDLLEPGFEDNCDLKKKLYSIKKTKQFETSYFLTQLGMKYSKNQSFSWLIDNNTTMMANNNKLLPIEKDNDIGSCFYDFEPKPVKAEKGSLVDKFFNIFVDNQKDLKCHSQHQDVTKSDEHGHMLMNDECENNSNIRGDICGKSGTILQSKNKPVNQADLMWNEYIKQNHSVILHNFQGQLESTVVCCECSHSSTMYEPFMYLSVPIPHALEQQYDIWIVPLKGEMSKHSVYTLKQGQVKDLRNSLEYKLKLDPNLNSLDMTAYVLCEVKSNRIFTILENTMRLKCLSKSRELKLIEVLDALPEIEKSEDTSSQVCQPTTWNSCCICLEDLADQELLKHDNGSCSITMCHTCLQTSAEHYGIENFECPMCHLKCSPTDDFVQLSSTSLDREIVISVSFTCENDEEKVIFVASSRVFKTLTSLSNIQQVVKQLLPSSLSSFCDYGIYLSTLDGAMCSRCDMTKHCNGCVKGDFENSTLMPGDNITVRFSKNYKLHQKFSSAELFCENKKEKHPLTLEHCLEAFTQNETLDDRNPWFCPSCKSAQTAEKRLKICRWPSTLIVYIKRFLFHSKTSVKVDDEVHFPLECFTPGLISGTDLSNVKNYNLAACISHYGGIYSGHYTAYSKHNETKKWYLYNDEDASEKIPSGKDSSNAYVLFYQETH